MPFFTTYLNSTISSVKDEFDYLAFASDYDTPDGTEAIADANEVGRVALTPTISGVRILIDQLIATGTITLLSSTIDGAGASVTEFDLVSVTGLAVGDRIEVLLSTGAEEVKISAISTNTITLDSTTPLSSIPVGSEVVRQLVSRWYLVSGGSITPNSGTSRYISVLKKYVPSSGEGSSFTFAYDLKFLDN